MEIGPSHEQRFAFCTNKDSNMSTTPYFIKTYVNIEY